MTSIAQAPTPRRGQAALEFLTTYGWAILIILVMIGALSYFGVMNPGEMVPDKCVFSAGIGCQEYAAITSATEDDTIQAKLLNGFGYAITISDVTVRTSGVGDLPCTDGGTVDICTAANKQCGLADPDGQWATEAMKELKIPCEGMSKGMHPRADVEITYQKSDGTYKKLLRGDILVKVGG
jgi:hypothetical protein